MAEAARIVEPHLLRREQAAQWLNLSLRQFDRLKADIPAVVCGKRQRLYDVEDLQRWADERKHLGDLPKGRARKRSKSTSESTGSASVSPQAQAILQRLKRLQRGSTPKLFPVAASNDSGAKK